MAASDRVFILIIPNVESILKDWFGLTSSMLPDRRL